MKRTRKAALITVFLAVLGGCAVGQPKVGSVATDITVYGHIKMDVGGKVTVTFEPDKNGWVSPTVTLQRGDPAYDTYVNEVGGLLPGEYKSLIRYRRSITMNNDRSLTLFAGGGYPGEEPFERVIKPGDPLYDKCLKDAGGLIPGQVKEWK